MELQILWNESIGEECVFDVATLLSTPVGGMLSHLLRSGTAGPVLAADCVVMRKTLHRIAEVYPVYEVEMALSYPLTGTNIENEIVLGTLELNLFLNGKVPNMAVLHGTGYVEGGVPAPEWKRYEAEKVTLSVGILRLEALEKEHTAQRKEKLKSLEKRPKQ